MKTSHASVVALIGLLAAGAVAQDIPANKAKQIMDAAPAKARVEPKKPRTVLIFNTPSNFLERDPHKGYCSPFGTAAMKALGEKTGAFTPVVSNDQAMLLPENIRQFDVIILNNTAGEWTSPSDELMAKLGRQDKAAVDQLLRKSLLDWVQAGGGVVAYHFAAGANRSWPEFHEMLGGRCAGHAWNRDMGFQVEEPDHPLVAAFGGKGFRQREETFQYAEPWSREKVRVLISLDNEASNVEDTSYKIREDRDFAIAWVKDYGKGRVFYTAFGHNTELYWSPVFLQFYLDGIQFAAGDLDAPTEPRAGKPANPSRAPAAPAVPPADAKPQRQRAPASQPAASSASPVLTALLAGMLAQSPFDPAGMVLERGRYKAELPSAELVEKIEAAMPDKPPVQPAQPRKVLVWGPMWSHTPNATAAKALDIMAQKTGAFQVVISDDPKLMLPDSLKQFDAVVINNWHLKEPFLPDDLKNRPRDEQDALRQQDQAIKTGLLEYVKGGKGVVGVHAATAACRGWPEYGEMMGGYFTALGGGRAWLRNEDPENPVNAALEGKDWDISDEVYTFADPYSRQKCRVLLSLNLEKMKDPGRRPDKDYAMAWVKPYGQGRVYYNALGHMPAVYANPTFLRHLLAGIQFATGDLEAPLEPKAP